MTAPLSSYLSSYLSEIEDFRNTESKNFRHPLLDILLLSICAVFSGAEDFEEIALFGQEKEEFLKDFIVFPCGVPSHDTIRRVFLHRDAESFNRQFMAWVKDSLSGLGLSFKQISIDGQTYQTSHWTARHNRVVDYQVSVCQDFTWVESRPKWQEVNTLVKGQTQKPNSKATSQRRNSLLYL